ncbi:MAG: polyhydroxyalkanoate synthesis regulator phasin [Haloarculaceae archaeon]|jgi:polyhydroxyalkanoate synthesis regulator phasin
MDGMDGGEMPGAIVEEFLQRERGTRALLEDLEKLSVQGDHEVVRDRIREFAEANRSTFFTVALALANSKHFFGDVESQLGVQAADRLRDLADTYPTLAEPFGIVRMEMANDRKNPLTGMDVTTSYHEEEEVPLIAYTAHSGEMALYESRGSPQEVLQSASYLVQATNDALEAALEKDHSVNTDELSELIDRREQLESELGQLRDRIDELRRKPVGDE